MWRKDQKVGNTHNLNNSDRNVTKYVANTSTPKKKCKQFKHTILHNTNYNTGFNASKSIQLVTKHTSYMPNWQYKYYIVML